MKYPELTITTNNEGSQILWEATETHRTLVGKVCGPGKATRLVACWNACRDFDDPEKGVEALRAIDTANEALRSALNRSQQRALDLQEELRVRKREHELRFREIDELARLLSGQNDVIGELRTELSNSQTHATVLQDQLRVNKLAYDALRDWAIGKTWIRQPINPCAQPEVNVQDGAYESFMRFTTTGPGIETTSYVSTDKFLAEENGKLRKAGCKLAEAAIRVASEYDGVHRLMLAVAEWSMAVANEGGRGDNHQYAATSTA